jgi:hypothetical protein
MGLLGEFFNAHRNGGRTRPDESNPWDLQRALFYLSKFDPYTLRMACSGMLILGMLGASKTTGSAARVLLSFLLAGMGGVYTCVKPGDFAFLRWLCELSGRLESLIEVSPANAWRCNLTHYVLNRPGIAGSKTEQAVNLLMTIVESAERGSKYGGSDHAFFDRQTRKLIRAGTEISYRADKTSSIDKLEKIFKSLPSTHGQVNNVSWQESSECYKTIVKGDTMPMTAREQKDFGRHAKFLLDQFIEYPPDTRGSVIASWDAVADPLLSGQIADLFDTTTNFVPEMSFDGAIIALNVPINVYGDAGRLMQTAFTWAWMTAAEQRKITDTSPCAFYFSDEAHQLVYRDLVQGFANTRSSRICPVLISQNLPAFYDAAGSGGRDWADSLSANLNTKVLHCNGDSITNEKMSQMIADEIQTRINWHGNPESGQGRGGGGEAVGRKVMPSEFTTLMKGGPETDFISEAVVFQSGARFIANDAEPFLRTKFKQLIPGVTEPPVK